MGGLRWFDARAWRSKTTSQPSMGCWPKTRTPHPGPLRTFSGNFSRFMLASKQSPKSMCSSLPAGGGVGSGGVAFGRAAEGRQQTAVHRSRIGQHAFTAELTKHLVMLPPATTQPPRTRVPVQHEVGGVAVAQAQDVAHLGRQGGEERRQGRVSSAGWGLQRQLDSWVQQPATRPQKALPCSMQQMPVSHCCTPHTGCTQRTMDMTAVERV